MAGKWFGPMPLDEASDCKMELKDSRFDFVCRGINAWTGQGTYQVRANILRLEFNWIAQKGIVLKNKPEPVELKIDGQMNHLTVQMPSGEKVIWLRNL
jgi:hypothetical protein